MKKKLKDLTIQEIYNICMSHKGCSGCPFTISGVWYDDDEHEECMLDCRPHTYDCYYNTEIELEE